LLINYYILPKLTHKKSLIDLTRKWNEITEINENEEELHFDQNQDDDNFIDENEDFAKALFIIQLAPLRNSFKSIIEKYIILDVSLDNEDNKFILSILKVLKISIEFSLINEKVIGELILPLKKMLNGIIIYK
jgi:hypothetical protein